MHLACRSKRLAATKVLYDAYPQALHVCDEGGKTPIELVKKGRVKSFLKEQSIYAHKSQDISAMTTLDHNGWLPLHHALKDNAALGSIKLLVEGNPSAIQTADNMLAFPLHIACEFSSLQVVRFLLDYDDGIIPMYQMNSNKDSILHCACRRGNLAVIMYLIESHASLVASMEVNLNEKLPLHLLCESGMEEDNKSVKYIETIWRMLLADPEALRVSV